jgi:hypothetical protein
MVEIYALYSVRSALLGDLHPSSELPTEVPPGVPEPLEITRHSPVLDAPRQPARREEELTIFNEGGRRLPLLPVGIAQRHRVREAVAEVTLHLTSNLVASGDVDERRRTAGRQ